jgi:hypothetical protein
VVNSSVTITGTNFTGTTVVQFNGTSATFTVDSNTQIRATVPVGATSGSLSVQNGAGTANSAGSFTVILGPVITSFSPASGPIGASVTITGSNFVDITQVAFNGVAVSGFTVDSATQIRTTVPNGSTTGAVSVTNSAATGNSLTDFVVEGPPSVTAFTPTQGIIGSSVTISGDNFNGATEVSFNGTSATFTVESNTEIHAVVPIGGTTGLISVTNPLGSGSSSENFVVVLPPSITSFTPTNGPIGAVVTISGTNFVGVSSVSFNGTAATVFTIVSNSELHATVPNGTTTGPVAVTNAAGTATSAANFNVTNTSGTLSFNVTHDAYVRSSNVNNNYGEGDDLRVREANSGELTHTYLKFNVTGLNETVLSAVVRLQVLDTSNLGGLLYSVSNNFEGTSTPWTEGTITFGNAPQMTGSPVSTLGQVTLGQTAEFNVTAVVNGNGVYSFGMRSTSNDAANYSSSEGTVTPVLVLETTGGTTSLPAVTSFTPTGGTVGVAVTVTGFNFTGATSVRFNGVIAAGFVVDSDSQIRVNVPAGATTGAVSVTNGSGTGASSSSFTVIQAPTVTSFSPTSGIVGTPITITGGNFVSVSGVSFSGTAATSFTVDSATQIRANVPAGATSGPISVTNVAGTGASSTNFNVIQSPTVTAFTPTSGGVNTQVTITGGNFTGSTAVTFNGLNATSFEVDSDTQVRATAPAGVTTGPIAVTNPAGAATSSGNFTVLQIPSITSFAPTSGTVGTAVTINGGNFNGSTAVAFNGVDASTFTVLSNSQIATVVPAAATTGPISVTNADGSGQSLSNFVLLAAPVITSFTPTSGPVGTPVTITGNSFTGITTLLFNSTPAASFIFDSDTQVRANVPAGATSGPISISNSAGSGNSASNFTVTTGGSSTLTFNATDDAYVRSTNVNNNYGNGIDLRVRTANSGEVTTSYLKFNVTGLTGAVSSAKVRLNVLDTSNQGGSIFSVSNTLLGTGTPWTESVITFNNAPAISGSPLATLGQVTIGQTVEFDVTAAISGNGVFSFGLSSSSNDAANYSSKEGASVPELVIVSGSGGGASNPPNITSFNPTSGIIGAQVTIIGSNFDGTTGVSFNATSATSFTIVSNLQIRATVPGGATSGPISVTNADGTAQSSSNFTVLAPPSITSFTPTSGPVGTAVTITGTNFTGVTSITFNGTPSASFTLDSDTQARAVVPAAGTSGPIIVSNAAGNAGSVSNFTVTQTPSITSFTPVSAPMGTQITITGLNFTGTTAVSFNGLAASTFTIDSPTQIRAAVAPGSTTGKISITSGDGTGLSTNDFVVMLPPTVTSFTPTSGPVGTAVTITGTNLIGVIDISFNGVAATSFSLDSPTQVRANVPAGTTTGKISVTNAAGTGISVNDFTIGVGSGTFTFTSSHDTYVRSSRVDESNGTDATVKVRTTTSVVRNSFFKFVISGVSGTIQSATLRLRVAIGGNDGGGIYSVSNNYIGTSTEWDELGLQWQNAPEITGSPLSTLGAVVAGNTVEFDVTAAVAGNGTFSFAISNNSNDLIEYVSKEGANAPELVVVTGVLPKQTDDLAEETDDSDKALEEPILPKEVALLPNYPNPFNAETNIEYTLPRDSKIKLGIFNVKGQLVRVLIEGEQKAGVLKAQWDGTNTDGLVVGSGVYFVRLEVGESKLSRKITLQK